MNVLSVFDEGNKSAGKLQVSIAEKDCTEKKIIEIFEILDLVLKVGVVGFFKDYNIVRLFRIYAFLLV